MPRPFSLLATVLLALSGAVAAPAAAQAPPAPAEPPAAVPVAVPPAPEPVAEPAAETAEPAEPQLEPGDVRVKAESYEQREKGHAEARGTVDLRMADMRILADRADVYDEPQPDGTTRRRFVAEGNVVFIRGEERLAGDRLEMDDGGRGFIDNAVGYVEPGVFVEARRVERVDQDTYKVQGGRFTACSQPNPRWRFSASRARIDVDDKIVATHTVFRVKGVPAFYLPWVYYPISRDGRSTGFLFPSLGYSGYKGFEAGGAFFWAMGRSADQTFQADYYSKLGYGLGHELRWARQSPSRGSLRTYLFQLTPIDPVLDPGSGEVLVPGREARFDYDIDWNAMQVLPGNARATLNLRKFSDLLFQQRFQSNFDLATSRSERYSGAVERDLKLAVVSAYAESTSTYFGAAYANVSGRLPGISLRRFPRQVGWGGIVVGLQAAADRLRYGNQERVDEWLRYDVAPTVSRPFAISFLEFSPSVGYRYTRYGSSLATRLVPDGDGGEEEQAGIFGPPIDRSFFETAVDMRGPTFARVFDTPGFFSERIKHTIGPEVTWRYRTRVDGASQIPKFDGLDWYYGENEVNYSLVQRFYSKRRGPSGRSNAWAFLDWRLMQTYYAQINAGQNNFDPNYSSSSYGPGYRREHLSPLFSRWRLRPSPEYSLDYSMEYDVNFQQFTRMSAGANIATARLALNGTWSRRLRTSEKPEERVVGSHTLRGNTALSLWPDRLLLEGSVTYDLLRDTLLHLRGQLRYSVQCCGFTVEYTRYDWNQYVDSSWRFNVELAGIGSSGSFLGAAAPAGRQGLGGYR